MIVDAHCHAWERWPYETPVPDPESRGRVEQLLHELNENGVGRAVIVCAGLGDNATNNVYVADAVARHPGRLVQFADIDSRWTPTFHAPGAAARLQNAANAFGLSGFTHYLRENEPDDARWLLGEEGMAFLRAAAERGLILSLACGPMQMEAVAEAAARFPSLPILIHHFGRVRTDLPGRSGMAEMVAAARRPNICVKVSGFGYAAPAGAYPYPETEWIVRTLYEFFGPERLCWGSDYPVVRRFMTYRQAIEIARRQLAFMPESERALVLGGTMARLLAIA